MVYRPTVRYDDLYKDYVDSLFQTTTLDRNQIIRLGLFLLGYTQEGKQILKSHLKSKNILPPPPWNLSDYGYFTGSRVEIKEEGGTPTENKQQLEGGTSDANERRKREIPVYKSTNTGEIKIVIGN